MFGLYTVEILVISSLLLAWHTNTQKSIKQNQKILCGLLLLGILVFIATLRDGSINPDHKAYLQLIFFPQSHKGDIEESFFIINSFVKFCGGSFHYVFFIYALIAIGIKTYAIFKYSVNIFFSICVWLSFSFILHDLIQIRAAISAGCLLLMIPYVYKKKYLEAIIIWIIAFFFHNSSIIFGLLFLLKRDTFRPFIWIIAYLIIFIVNVFDLPIFTYIVKLISILPGFLSDRIGIWNPTVLDGLSRMKIYSRYALIPSLFCILAIFYRNKSSLYFPETILCLKICFIGIFIFGIGLPIVSERIFELLSVSYIFLVPTSLYWFKHNSELKGKIITIIFCLFMSWNLLFKQEVFSN